MQQAIALAFLLLIGSLAGCLEDEKVDYSNFEGCAEGDLGEECSTDIEEENLTSNVTSAEIGTYENQTLPLIEGSARGMNGTWGNWSSADLFNNSDNWVLIQFAATDCGHCWNGAELMSELHENYSDQVTFMTFIINFTWSNSSLTEIAAFQDEANFSGCNGDRNNCNERPGSPHNWTYFDDRTLDWLIEFHMTGTPAYVLIQPDGIVGWHQKQRTESIQDAMANLFTPAGA
jgi:hypothetical protein